MLWTPAVVARMALDAGWDPDSAVEAVAFALATSRGDDTWLAGSWRPDVPTYVGLWGVPVDRNDWARIDQLRHPRANAAAARALWLDHGQRFDWAPGPHPVDRDLYEQVAREAVAHPQAGMDQIEADFGRPALMLNDGLDVLRRMNWNPPGTVG